MCFIKIFLLEYVRIFCIDTLTFFAYVKKIRISVCMLEFDMSGLLIHSFLLYRLDKML